MGSSPASSSTVPPARVRHYQRVVGAFLLPVVLTPAVYGFLSILLAFTSSPRPPLQALLYWPFVCVTMGAPIMLGVMLVVVVPLSFALNAMHLLTWRTSLASGALLGAGLANIISDGQAWPAVGIGGLAGAIVAMPLWRILKPALG